MQNPRKGEKAKVKMNIKKENGEITVEITTEELRAAKWHTDSNPQTYHIGIYDDYCDGNKLDVIPDDMDDVYYGASAKIGNHTITISDDADGLHYYCDYDDCNLIVDGYDAGDITNWATITGGTIDWDIITGGAMQWFDAAGDDYDAKAAAINDWVDDAYAHDVRIVRVDGDYCNTYTLYICHSCDADRGAQGFGGDVLLDVDDAADALRLAMISNRTDKYYCTINIEGLTHTGYGIAPDADNAWIYKEAVKWARDYLQGNEEVDSVDIIAESIQCQYDDYSGIWRWWQSCDPVKYDTITRGDLED